MPDDRLGQRVVAFVEWAGDSNDLFSAEQWSLIQAVIRDTVGPYAVPKTVTMVARFAETPTGKVDKLATMGLKS